MTDDNKKDFQPPKTETPQRAQRARNRTVMLTPELTGEVRNLISRESGGMKQPEESIPGISYSRKPDSKDDAAPAFSFGKALEEPSSDWGFRPDRNKPIPGLTEPSPDMWSTAKTSESEPDSSVDRHFKQPLKEQFAKPFTPVDEKSEVTFWSGSQEEEPQPVVETFSRMDFAADEPDLDQPINSFSIDSASPASFTAAPIEEPVIVPIAEPVVREYRAPVRETVAPVVSRHEPVKKQEIVEDTVPQRGEELYWENETALAGFLVSFDNSESGEYFPLRIGRLIISSEQPNAGSYLLLDDPSVSPMHAIIRIGKDGRIQVLDQLSETGTKILRANKAGEVDLSGDKSDLSHGDMLIFGNRQFVLCLVDLSAVL